MRILVWVTLSIFATLNAYGVEKVDIYTQSVLVEKNANTTRVSKMRTQAMLQALKAATLKNDINNVRVIKEGLKGYKQYIISEKVNASDEVFISVIGQEIPMVELVIEFDEKKIQQLLRKANLSTLSSTRPEVLAVILVQHKDGSTEILSREDLYAVQPEKANAVQMDEQTLKDLQLLEGNLEGNLPIDDAATMTSPFYESVAQMLEQSAKEIKLPFIWPMMDPQDLFFFDQNNFWQVDKDSILGFAKRYKPQVILIARIKEHSDGRFIGEWNVLDLGRPKVQYYDSLEQFTQSGLKQVAQTVVQQYGINPNDKKDEQVLVKMNQVSSVTDFHKNEKFLSKLSGVASVVSLDVNGFDVTYLLQLNVSQKQFLTTLELNESLGFFIEDELRRPVILNVVISED